MLAANIIIKIYRRIVSIAIQESIHKILIDYGKFHMTHDVTLLLSIGRTECQQYSQIKLLLVHRTQWQRKLLKSGGQLLHRWTTSLTH